MTEADAPRDLESLIGLHSRGAPLKYLYFWGHTPTPSGNHVFSQWFPHPFDHEGVTYPTAEHAMMAAKARLFGDEEALRRVLAAGHPGRAKAAGREVAGFSEQVWAAHRFELVAAANVAKFASSPALRAHLLGTGSRVLVEASPLDRIWGIGLAADDPRAADPARWRGPNLLGFALMHARAALS